MQLTVQIKLYSRCDHKIHRSNFSVFADRNGVVSIRVRRGRAV